MIRRAIIAAPLIVACAPPSFAEPPKWTRAVVTQLTFSAIKKTIWSGAEPDDIPENTDVATTLDIMGDKGSELVAVKSMFDDTAERVTYYFKRPK